MIQRKRRSQLDRSLLYTHCEELGDEAELVLAMIGADSVITGRSISLDRCVLNRTRITYAPGMRVSKCEAETIDCANAEMEYAAWRDSSILDSRWTGARVNFSHLSKVTFSACQMSHVQFQESTLRHVGFDSCDLTGAYFNGAVMNGTVFAGSNLTGADFSRADISECDFRRANIENIRLAPDQLRGVIVTQDQAIYLARMLGLDIRE